MSRQWPMGAAQDTPQPYRTPTSKGRTPADGRRPITTSKTSDQKGNRK